ncbi:hypothetical protein D3273_10620 [Lichenibacterium minor]|uniref:Uncharacterized protein n=1 Tax=Lichenibacterium minor TaxID=2316528 RepID=A0A4Q2U5N3_9HYPH|nr:hypothetical protein [Lichenibacterium minor]RYC31883.1 hypothetical protein D3273_10620 [Lichenibacterium minor]
MVQLNLRPPPMLLDDGIEDRALLDLRRAAAGTRRDAAVPTGPRDPSPGADDLPPELAFLVAQGVAPALVRRAARIAAELGTPGEDALFGLGFPDERYGRLLARHLGAPYLRRPLALAREGLDVAAAAAVGWARLAPHRGRVGNVCAPRGDKLRLLLDRHRFEDVGSYDFAITTRRRFEALLRRHDAAGLGERAASGLAGWDAALSARGGATPAQLGAALGLVAALALGVAVAPGPTALAASAALFCVFAAAVAQRLVVVAASAARTAPPPLAPLPDRDLPVYTLVVPLFRETRVLPRLVRALDAIDYPALCRKRNKRHPMRYLRNRL